MEDAIKNKLGIIDTHIWALTRGNRFLYFNMDKLSTNELKWFINQKFYKELGYFPNIDNPKSYNEKSASHKNTAIALSHLPCFNLSPSISTSNPKDFNISIDSLGIAYIKSILILLKPLLRIRFILSFTSS